MKNISISVVATLFCMSSSAYFNIYPQKNWADHRAANYIDGSFVYEKECSSKFNYYMNDEKDIFSSLTTYAFTIKEEVSENGKLIISQETLKTPSIPSGSSDSSDTSAVVIITKRRHEGNREYRTTTENATYYSYDLNNIITRSVRIESVAEMENGKITTISYAVDGVESNPAESVESETIQKDPFYTSYITITKQKFKPTEENNYALNSTDVCHIQMLGIKSYIDLIPNVILGKWNFKNSINFERIEFLKNRKFVLKVKNSDSELKGTYQIENDKILLLLGDGESSFLKMKFDSAIDLYLDDDSDQSFLSGESLKKIVE